MFLLWFLWLKSCEILIEMFGQSNKSSQMGNEAYLRDNS